MEFFVTSPVCMFGTNGIRDGVALSPLRGLLSLRPVPTACAVGCTLSPLPGWGLLHDPFGVLR